jgi:PAS domain S-box-containing protein
VPAQIQRSFAPLPEDAEQPYRAFFEAMNEGAALLLSNGAIAYSNGCLAAMLKTSPGRLTGKSIEAFAEAGDRPRLKAYLAQGLGGACRGEFRLRSGDGDGVWVQLALSPVAFEGASGLCLVAGDITDRKKAEAVRSYGASIVEFTGDAVIGQDLNGTIMSWNPAAEKLYGYSAGEIVGQPIARLSPPELAGEEAGILERIARAETVDPFETERVRKDGARIHVSLTISPVRDAEGRILGASTIARDIGVRKQADDAIRKATAELKESQRVARLGRWRLDRATGRMFWSKELYRLNGRDPKLAPPSVSELDTLFTPTSLKRVNRSALRMLKAGSAEELEAEFVRRDGSGVNGWVMLRGEPVRDASGEVTAIQGVAWDISERKQAEQRLKEQAELLDDLYNRAPCGYHLLDSNGAFIRINDTALSMLGYTREELIGKNFADFLTPAGVADFQSGYPRVKESGSARDLEFEMVRKDGSGITVLLQATVVRGARGEFVATRSSIVDITARKRAERALREAQAIANLASWTWDPEADTTTWSEEAHRIFGRDPNLPARSLATHHDIVDHKTLTKLHSLARRALQTGQPYELDLEVLHSDGTSRWVVLRGQAERDGEGRIVGLFGTVQDITTRKFTEEALWKRAAELREAQRVGRVGSWQFLPKTQVLIWSEETYRIFGLLPGRPLPHLEELWQTFLGESRTRMEAAFADLLENGTTYELDLRFRRPDGQERWLTWRGEAARDFTGRISMLRGTLQDITERKKTEEELRHLNENLERLVAERTGDIQAILDAAPIPIWIAHDQECRRIAGNVYADRIGSMKRVQDGRELRPEEYSLASAAATGQSLTDNEVDLALADGRTMNLLMSCAPLFDAEGRVRGAVAAGSDVTALRRVERALRDNEQRLALALRASQEGVWDWNLETNAVWYSSRWTEMLGYEGHEIEPHLSAWQRLLHPADRERSRAKMEAVRNGEPEYAMEFRMRHKNGHYVPILSRGIAVRRQEGGPIVRMVGTHFELTERKVHEALRRVSAYHRSLIEANLDPMVTIAPDGTIADVNRAAENATGLSRDELIGTDFSHYFTHSDKAREAYEIAFRDGLVKDYELEIQHRDGRAMPVLYNASVYRDEAGRAAGVFAAARDIGQRKRAEEALVQQTEELGRSNSELRQFAYVASHDLQEPLRMVSNFTGLLGARYKGKLDEDADEYIKYATEGARRAQVLITDLLAYSRVGTRGVEFFQVDCEIVLRDALNNLLTVREESGGQVTHDPLPTVEGDWTQLGQVFQNLIGNALKFRGKEPPRVHVSAEQTGETWRFSVRDNGIGIDPRYTDKIFQVFQRLHSKEEYPGTGIGLAVVKKVVERHGGRIWVESEPGMGANFQFTIPAGHSS